MKASQQDNTIMDEIRKEERKQERKRKISISHKQTTGIGRKEEGSNWKVYDDGLGLLYLSLYLSILFFVFLVFFTGLGRESL